MRACLRNDAEAKRTPAAVSPVRTFAPAFLTDSAERWKAVKRLIPHAVSGRRVDATGSKDARNWFDDHSVTRAGSANRALAGLSSTMKHAEALGLRREDSNPGKGLRRRRTGFETYYLTDDVFAALGRALDGRTQIIRSPSPWCASRSTPRRASPRRCGSSGSRFTATARYCRTARPVRARSGSRRSSSAPLLSLGVRVALRRTSDGGRRMERDPRGGGTADAAHSRSQALGRGGRDQRRRGPVRRRRAAWPCRHQDHLRLYAPCGVLIASQSLRRLGSWKNGGLGLGEHHDPQPRR